MARMRRWKLAAGAHVEIAHELLAQIGVPAFLTFLPRVRRDLVLLAPRLAGLLFFPEPCHSRNVNRLARQSRLSPSTLRAALRDARDMYASASTSAARPGNAVRVADVATLGRDS